MSENRKPYVKWTTAEHYRQSVELMEAMGRIGSKMESGEIDPNVGEGMLVTLRHRAQLHATLACVEPRIRLIAETMTDWGKEDYS